MIDISAESFETNFNEVMLENVKTYELILQKKPHAWISEETVLAYLSNTVLFLDYLH